MSITVDSKIKQCYRYCFLMSRNVDLAAASLVSDFVTLHLL